MIFIIIIYGYIYIKYKYQKKKETQLFNKKQKKLVNNPKHAKLQKSYDQLYDNYKYPLLNYGWGGCLENKPTTKATKTTKATEIIQVKNPNSWFKINYKKFIN